MRIGFYIISNEIMMSIQKHRRHINLFLQSSENDVMSTSSAEPLPKVSVSKFIYSFANAIMCR